MAIRRLADNGGLTGRITINNMEIVFHQTAYLKNMPGFLMIPNFDPTASRNDLKFIKLWPPPSIAQEIALENQTIETTNVIDPQEIVYEEVTEEAPAAPPLPKPVEETPVDPIPEPPVEATTEITEEDVKEAIEASAEEEPPTIPVEEVAQIVVENTSEIPSDINYDAFNNYYIHLNDNKYWGRMTKSELTKLLTEANVNFDGIDERWNLIKLAKKVMRERKTQG
jgi:hypothetical protein